MKNIEFACWEHRKTLFSALCCATLFLILTRKSNFQSCVFNSLIYLFHHWTFLFNDGRSMHLFMYFIIESSFALINVSWVSRRSGILLPEHWKVFFGHRCLFGCLAFLVSSVQNTEKYFSVIDVSLGVLTFCFLLSRTLKSGFQSFIEPTASTQLQRRELPVARHHIPRRHAARTPPPPDFIVSRQALVITCFLEVLYRLSR